MNLPSPLLAPLVKGIGLKRARESPGLNVRFPNKVMLPAGVLIALLWFMGFVLVMAGVYIEEDKTSE